MGDLLLGVLGVASILKGDEDTANDKASAHLEDLEEDVDVESPDTEALADGGEDEGEGDDEEEGGKGDIKGAEGHQLDQHGLK